MAAHHPRVRAVRQCVQWFEREVAPKGRGGASGGGGGEGKGLVSDVPRYKLGHADTIDMACIRRHGTLFDLDNSVPSAPYVLLSEEVLASRNDADDARLGGWIHACVSSATICLPTQAAMSNIFMA